MGKRTVKLTSISFNACIQVKYESIACYAPRKKNEVENWLIPHYMLGNLVNVAHSASFTMVVFDVISGCIELYVCVLFGHGFQS